MTLYEQESVNNKLFRLKEIIKILEEVRVAPREDFVKDGKLNGAAMFNLLIGITIILDVGQHLLAQVAQRTAHEYKEAIKLLGEEKIIPFPFADENEKMASFRNMLVHEYDKVDLAQVHDYLQKAPDIFRAFAKYFVEFMEKQP
ncbi:MAG: hypothetical protein COV91_06330 [Candidatus Taylorbacteria bacterium CG11_big_fil_rev_8_21_14_0_20_46_11]|uniref:DUF86 domain-containing protein n=1 Tax=Candidatus Taylorbacteria bacterium CG11_big_fil_rev_8_21_14_0_20_46_11 TaxID=1975025 RepID=A0A2H0K9S1_9BACT|nr:MAG: hypothetical protein COV91_06330 [Candidatus Taylorbacteria bacterium CG11_big_fil_rev_8_21_14_0_20_46_11]